MKYNPEKECVLSYTTGQGPLLVTIGNHLL